MSVESKRALLLSGPQHYDERRPVISKYIKRPLEHVDPLGIAIVSACLKKYGIDTSHLTMEPDNVGRLEKLIPEFDGVFISARYFDASLALFAASVARKNKKPAVVGGYAPTFHPDLFPEGTSLVFGEAERLLAEIADDFVGGKLKNRYDGNAFEPPDIYNEYIWPDRTIFPRGKGPMRDFYKHPIEVQRGCKNSCSYCIATRMQRADCTKGRREVRTRNPDDVIKEIESLDLKPGSNVFFVDLNISTVPKDSLRTIFSYLQKERIRWYAEGTVSQLVSDLNDAGEEKSLLKLMSAKNGLGGCYTFMYGADDIVAKKVEGSRDKSISVLNQSIEIFRRFGIPLNLSVVVGLEEHNYPESFFHIASTLKEVGYPYTFVFAATPYRGSPWGDSIYNSGRVFDEETIHHNQRRVVFTPKNMTAQELYQGYIWLNRQLSGPKAMSDVIKRNHDRATLSNNPMLGVIQTGLPWLVETALSLKELELRGYVDKNIQNTMDNEYKRWSKQR